MECRIVLKRGAVVTEVGMHDPQSGRYVPIGSFRGAELDRAVRDLKVRMEQAGHTVTFSEKSDG